MLHKDFKELLKLLNGEKVEYLLVGGYAVGFYGYPRYTGDLDIWVKPSPENAQKVLVTLGKFGFSSLGLEAQDFREPGFVIQLGYPPVRIDIITELDNVIFDECYKRRLISKIEGVDVSIIGIDDLLLNKKATGRHKDLDDVEHLQ